MWLTAASLVLAVAGTTFGIIMGFRKDSRDSSASLEKVIDERIILSVGVTLAEIKASVASIQSSIPSGFAGRVTNLEGTATRHEKDLGEAFERIRELEKACARSGGSCAVRETQ